MKVSESLLLIAAVVSAPAFAQVENTKVFSQDLGSLHFNGAERLEQDIDEDSSRILETDTRAYRKILISDSNKTGILVTPNGADGSAESASGKKESLLYVFKNKNFDVATGTFSSDDPVGIGTDEVNVYNYVRNNPLRYVDPDGLSAKDVADMEERMNKYVKFLNDIGMRRPGSGNLNNIVSSFGGGTLGCEDQAYNMKNRLEAGKYDDQWTFKIQGRNYFPPHPNGSMNPLPHWWVEGTSSNPSDPFVVIDPWKEKFLPLDPK